MNVKKFGLLLFIITLTLSLGACWKQDSGKNVGKPSDKKEIDEVAQLKKEELERKKNEDKIRRGIWEYLQKNNISGTVAVVKDGQVIFNEGSGLADRDKKVPIQASTTYPIGSVTKTFVATSIMQLQEQGKLNIQDPISKYLPGFPNGNNIKLYHLLTHTSGLQPLHWHRGETTPLSLVQAIESTPLKFQPGTKWDYLDANYMVLGYILEKVTGMKLNEYIQANIFDKISMKETGFITPEHPVPYSSVGYLQNGDKIEPTKYLNTYSLFGCGNIYTTAYDLTKYDQAMMDGRLLSPDSLKQVLTPSGKSSYGLGLYNRGNIIFSIGVLGGWYSMHAYYPNDKLSIAILLNSRSKTTNIELINTSIYQIITGNTQQVAQK